MTNQTGIPKIRELVLEVLLEVLENGSYSHLVLRRVLTKYQYMTKQDRAFLSRLCEGTIEQMIELDYIINQFSSVKVTKMKPVIRNILRMGVYQIKYMNQVPDSAACNEAVKIAKKKGFQSLSGFVNGVLRSISRGIDEVKYPDEQKETTKYLSIIYSMPEWIIEKWMQEYDYETVLKILTSNKEEKKTTIRSAVNDISTSGLKERLEKEGVTVDAGNYLPYALKISEYNYMNDIQTFKDGLFQIQDESSMLVCEVAGIKENDIIIDVCAAPGGKSIHAAEKLNHTGHVSARDISSEKVALIESNISRLKIENITTMVWDAKVPEEDSFNKADIVIADLPCSGLGVLGKKTDIKYKMTQENQKLLVELQKDILSVVKNYVKSGGILIYSTCTINKEENIDNMRWFLKEFDFEADSLDPFLPESLCNQTTKEGYLQLLPGIHKTDGFFMARLRKR